MYKQSILIFSVFQKNRQDYENQDNTQGVLNILDFFNIGHKVLKGVYQGISEDSILVLDTPENRSMVEEFCSQFNQECYLYSDTERDSFLVYPDNSMVSIGTLKPVSKDLASKQDGYSLDVTTNTYWITV